MCDQNVASSGSRADAPTAKVRSRPPNWARTGRNRSRRTKRGRRGAMACSRSNCERLPVASTLRSIAFVSSRSPCGNDEHHRDLELAEGLDEDRRLPADRVGDGLAGRQRREEVAGQPEHVRQRQDREEALVRAEREDVDQGPGVRGDVAVGQHHALRVAGRARGEHHEQQVVGARRRPPAAARRRGQGRGATRSGSPAGRAGAPAPRSGATRGRASARSARRPWPRSRRCSARRAARRRARRAPRPGTRAPTPGG